MACDVYVIMSRCHVCSKQPLSIVAGNRFLKIIKSKPICPRYKGSAMVKKPPTYIGVADVQNHQAELTVLKLVQLMDQLSVVSLQHKRTQQRDQIPKHVRYSTSGTCRVVSFTHKKSSFFSCRHAILLVSYV